MEWTRKSDLETHVKKLDPTSKTEIKQKSHFLFLETYKSIRYFVMTFDV